MANSVFVTGTDTGVGKTFVAAGLVCSLRARGLDVGVMKPYSAGSGRFSADAEELAAAAGITVSGDINPEHQALEAPPYADSLRNPDRVMAAYRRLAARHDVLVVEGMGGAMVPILPDYYVVDLARGMNLPVMVVAANPVGSINHTIMTVMACRQRGVRVLGVVLNMAGDGYGPDIMRRCICDMLDIQILGVVPRTSADKAGGFLDIDTITG